MERFIEGVNRTQTTLLAECIDDHLDEFGARDPRLCRHAGSGGLGD
jgi:hypothetical protein